MATHVPSVEVASAARTANGNSGNIALAASKRPRNQERMMLVLDVTAHAGTNPTLDVAVEWSMNGTTFAPAQPADDFTQVTETDGAHSKSFTVKGTSYRMVWVITGTAGQSYTFSVTEMTT